MVDFSHYSILPMSSFEKSIDRGDELTDHWFESLLDTISPPLFDPHLMDALRAELCWFAPKVHRGRPRRGCRREELAEAIRTLERSDVPAKVWNAIAVQLERPVERDRMRRPRSEIRKRAMERRNSSIWYVYDQLTKALIEGIEPRIPELVPYAESARATKKAHEDALTITGNFLREKLRIDPPSPRRMLNIISEMNKSHRDFVNAVSNKKD